MRHLAAAFALLLAAAPALAQTRIAIACGSVGVEAQLCREGVEDWARVTGHHAELVSTPAGSSERLALFQQLLAAGSADIDVFQLDIVWPGILGHQMMDLGALPRPAHLPVLIRNNTVGGRLVAMPWFTHAGALYYRRDLLEKHGRRVPETCEEMAGTAAAIMQAERAGGATRMQGHVFQGRAYEGLTVNALEWLGEGIVAPDGRVIVNTPHAAEVLAMAARWVGTITPRGVLNYAEEEARGVFQSGNAVFMRNWPYAWQLLDAPGSAVRGRVGVAPLPGGAAVLGGEQLGVSRHSRNPEVAVSLVLHLTGRAEQRRRAIAGGMIPTIPDLYDDAEVLAANPVLAELRRVLPNATLRPSAVTRGRYNQVSAEFWNAVHDVLAGEREAAPALARLERILLRVGRDGQW